MTTNTEFIRASSLTTEQVQAGIASGELKPWRLDRDGEQWFTRSAAQAPIIRGVPRDQHSEAN